MSDLAVNLSFDEWVQYVFHHTVDQPHWYHATPRPWWNEYKNPETTTKYIIQAFQSIENYSHLFSDAQLNQGLWFLADSSCSGYMNVLFDLHNDLPLSVRIDAIASMYELFHDLFRLKCSHHLIHLSESGANPLNLICYMWWDLIRRRWRSEEEGYKILHETVIDNLIRVLELDSDACQESALHGLGHWSEKSPDRIDEIIDNYLSRNQSLRPELATYALNAKYGDIR